MPEVTSTTEEQSHPYSLRECHLKSWHDGKGYGFNMQAEKNKPGQFIAKVDSGSPADLAGLRAGDRLVEVNRDSVATDTHRQVVDRIKSNPDETILLVVDAEADSYFNSKGITLSSSLPFVEKIVCPDSNPDAGNHHHHHHLNAPFPGLIMGFPWNNYAPQQHKVDHHCPSTFKKCPHELADSIHSLGEGVFTRYF